MEGMNKALLGGFQVGPGAAPHYAPGAADLAAACKRDVAPVEQAARSVDASIDTLGMVIGRLADRLQPVLSPATPAEVNRAGEKNPGSSELTGYLNAQALKVRQLEAHIDSLLRRLEL